MKNIKSDVEKYSNKETVSRRELEIKTKNISLEVKTKLEET